LAVWIFIAVLVFAAVLIRKKVKRGKQVGSQEFLGKLLDRRKQITVLRLNMRKRLINSSGIPAGQEVQVVLVDTGIFTTKVVPHDRYFAVKTTVGPDVAEQACAYSFCR
jgi:hypothetical protein